MGNIFSEENSSFRWEYTEEPHLSRRIQILKKYPEIKKFMRADGDRSLVVSGLCFLCLQFGLAYWAHSQTHAICRLFINCFVGNWAASLLLFHIHEAAHGTVFGPNSVWKNRLYGLVMNLGVGVPFYSFFKKHHKNHHKYIGDRILDAEYPSEAEVRLFPNTPLGKFGWLVLQPFIYTCRTPGLVARRPGWWWDGEELANVALMAALASGCFYLGCPYLWGHCAMSTLAASGSNIFGYWGIMSHTSFFAGRETFSYYGWLNGLFMNFGHHMEHHDFPSVPSRYLPEVRRIAPEFYDDFLHLDSFHTATVKYLFDPKIGVFSRLKRESDAEKISYFEVNNKKKNKMS